MHCTIGMATFAGCAQKAAVPDTAQCVSLGLLQVNVCYVTIPAVQLPVSAGTVGVVIKKRQRLLNKRHDIGEFRSFVGRN